MIVLKRATHVDSEAVLAEITLDGRSIGLDWGWGEDEKITEIPSMPVKERGKKGYYALRFGELVDFIACRLSRRRGADLTGRCGRHARCCCQEWLL